MKINRIHKIQELLEDNQSISINRLCDIFQVSKNTIRRDINDLEKKDLIKKVYGGIMLKPAANAPEPFASREIKNSPQKKQIARLAADLVGDGEVIYIDSGTTTMHMIPYLAEKNNITILTASLNVINAAAAYSNFNVIATGGTLYLPSKAFVGTSVLNCLKNYNISKAFLATTGISLEKGVTNAAPLEYEIKQYVVQKCSTKILLADTSKIDKASLMTFCQLKDVNYLIMEELPPQNYINYLESHHVRLLVNPPLK